MPINRHHVATVLDLGQVPAVERPMHQEALEGLLVTLYRGANAVAREAFTKRMEALSQTSRPWGAIVRPEPGTVLGLGPPIPPVLLLILGQVDDDPDSGADGNRLPDRDSKAGAPWAGLYAALDRWDVPAIRQHISPLGWWLPNERVVPLDEGAAVELAPAKVVVKKPVPPAKAQAFGRRATASAPAGPTPETAPPDAAPAPTPSDEAAVSSPKLGEALAHWPLLAGGMALGVATTTATVYLARKKSAP